MDWRAFSETFVTLLVIMDPVGTAPIFVALTAGRPSRERRETSGAGSPAVQPTAKSSAYTVPWAYQPCTKTVTLVVPAPVLNGTLSLV